MKLTLRQFDLQDFPSEFKNPEFSVNTLDNSFIKLDNDNTVKTELDINKINFFVGENNSGKSRFLRG